MKIISESRTVTLSENSKHNTIVSCVKNMFPHFYVLIEHPPKGLNCKISPGRCFFDLVLYDPKLKFNAIQFPLSHSIEEFVLDLIHVPALRGNPERTYSNTSFGPRFPGAFQNYVASIIYFWKENRDKRLEKLSIALETLGLTWKIDAKQIQDTRVEILAGRLPHAARGGARDLVSIADVGFGISQVLPVIVALLVSKKGQVIFIEQPEIHLHPRAQVGLAKILADAAARGVRVVIETHSARLLFAIRTLVAEGDIRSNNVKLHWFTRNPDTGSTTVASASLDKDGAFDDWPEDFGQVELEQESKYLDIVESRNLS